MIKIIKPGTLKEAIRKAIYGMEDVHRAYIADCYKAGREIGV